MLTLGLIKNQFSISHLVCTTGESHNIDRDVFGHLHLGLELLHLLEGGFDLSINSHLLDSLLIGLFHPLLDPSLLLLLSLLLEDIVILDCCNKLNQSK